MTTTSLLSHYQISILSPDYSDLGDSAVRANQVKANVTVSSASGHELVLLVSGMAPGRRYPLRLAAVNGVGAGPQAEEFLVVDPEMLLVDHPAEASYQGDHLSSSSAFVSGHVWIVAALASVAVVLVAISAFMIYHR